MENLIERVLQGDRRALARAISIVEDDGDDARRLLMALYPHTGRGYVIGVTGAPGTGKSTLVNDMAKEYRKRGLRVGIIAIDPTSPFSGGALLGDRVRMKDLSGDSGIFIRSMATRGSLGGLAKATSDVIMVMDAAGYDRIIVETVGVGQAEVDIASEAHTTIVVESPGLGDEIQAIKAGILEIADIFVVNKADREGADHTVMALKMMLGLSPKQVAHHGKVMTTGEAERKEGWVPPIIKTVAIRNEGTEELIAEIERHRRYLQESGQLEERELKRTQTDITNALQNLFLENLLSRITQSEWTEAVRQVAGRQMDPYSKAAEMLEKHGIADLDGG